MSLFFAVTALTCLAVGPLGAHFHLLAPVVGFLIHILAGILGLIAVMFGLVSWLRKRRRSHLIAVFLALPSVVPMAFLLIGATSHPGINDIATDLADPPLLSIAPEYPDSFKAVVSASYPDVKTLQVATSPEQAFSDALYLARSSPGWTITRVDERALIFEGLATTRVFRFKDDFVVRVRAVRGQDSLGATIDMRSRSRVGKSDLGGNARRIRSFFAELVHILAAPAQ
ncbi:MAG: DUF1499 domain-containing protein [Proteobacteria bacterium]|nr:DUF1499 domain-containing protein [Pseudomonadota bacterium]